MRERFEIADNSLVIYSAAAKEWLYFSNPIRIHIAQNLESVDKVLCAVEKEIGQNNLHAAGFLSYEASPAFDSALITHAPTRFPLVWFGIFKEPKRISLPSCVNDNPFHMEWKSSLSEKEYSQSFQKIKEWIQSGDTYQVNYTFRLKASFSDDPWQLFLNMIRVQGYGYGAFVNIDKWAICSASPELFFSLDGETLISRPMKGTVPRGVDLADDRRQSEKLTKSFKNRAENVMIVDMVRNDMGRVCSDCDVTVTGLYELEKYPTLWQMTSSVKCVTKSGLKDLLRALFPAASITGAPKIRTMQIIADLESTPRQIYTGTIGYFSPGRKSQFNVAIRTVMINKKNETAEYGVGGGIVWDSERRDEFDECYTKAMILTNPPTEFELLETILWTPETGLYLVSEHMERLSGSASYFSFRIDPVAIINELEKMVQKLPGRSHKLRLLVSRNGKFQIEAALIAKLPTPYRVGIAKSPVNSRNPFLYHKTTDRRIYDQSRNESPAYDDLLLWNEKGEMTESCLGNLIVEKAGVLLTPPISCGLLAGTYRSFLLKQGRVKEAIIRKEALSECSRFYLANSVRGIWEIFPDLSSIPG